MRVHFGLKKLMYLSEHHDTSKTRVYFHTLLRPQKEVPWMMEMKLLQAFHSLPSVVCQLSYENNY